MMRPTQSTACYSRLSGREAVLILANGEEVQFAWGSEGEIGTAAYWVGQTREVGHTIRNRLGTSLLEETAACILGGHGVSAEVGLAAFGLLRQSGLLDADSQRATARQIEAILRQARHRFARQRSEWLAGAVEHFHDKLPPSRPSELRDWLLEIKGVGPKTASWIVRNHLDADTVAIIDIHVVRAGVAAGFFRQEWRLERSYPRFESAFLEVARLGGVRASQLDAVIWTQMREFGHRASWVLPHGSAPGE